LLLFWKKINYVRGNHGLMVEEAFV